MAVRRSDGRWQAGVRHAGRRYTFYGATRAQADAAAEEFRRRVRGYDGLCLGEFFGTWLAGKELAAVTHGSYERLYRLWLAVLAPVPLKALTVADCQRVIDAAPAGSRRKALAVLRACLNDAMRMQLLEQNPARLVRVPAYQPKGKAMSRTEARAMLAHAGRYEPLYRTALGTGLRLGELLALRPADVVQGSLVVRKSKTRAGLRTVPVPPGIDLYAIASEDWLFTTRSGHCQPTYVRQSLYAACAAAGIQRYRFHDLRHTYATWALEGGIGLHVVSKLLGHSSVAVTADVYSHVSTERVDVSALAL